MPSPREEDINTMHRYRDAIVEENGIKPVQTAIVLFPGKQRAISSIIFIKVLNVLELVRCLFCREKKG
ncbi:hypothetical protein MUB15_07300 [Priestia sp. OVS21]|nr:hypothetical protein [Priestia sp. OVS21]